MTLGLTRNNPFNLEVRGVAWQGLMEQQPDTGPLAFVSLEEGLRAGIKAIWHLADTGHDTPEKFITAWAPPADNPTAQYIEDMCDWCKVDNSQIIDLHDDAFLLTWCHGLIRQEQGSSVVITDAVLQQAIADARA